MSFKIFNVVRLIYGVYNIKRGSRKLPSRHGLTIFQCVECEQRLVRFFRIILKGGNFLIAINLPRIWFGSFFPRKPSFFPRTKVSGESFTRVNGLLTGWRSSNSLYSFPHFPKFNSLISVFRGKWTNPPVWIVTKAYHEDGRWIFRQRLAIGLAYNGGRFRCSRATLHFPSSHLPLSVFYTHISLSFSSNTIAETITHTISFFPHSPEFELLSKERQSRRSSREGDFERFFQNIILSFHSDLLSLTQQRERDARERRRRVSPNSVHVSGPNCFAFYAFRFAIPFSFLDVVDHRFSRGYNARFDLVKDHGRVDPWKASVSPKRK